MNKILYFITAILTLSFGQELAKAQVPGWIWAKSAGGSSFDASYSIAIDRHGNAYITGSFNSSSINFGSTTLTPAGLHDVFVAKYDSNGNVIWAKSAGGSGSEGGYGISIDSSGYVYVTGSFYSTSIAFDNYILTNASTDNDMFVVKYDSSGNVIWAKSAGGSDNDYSSSIAADGYGNVYVTGRFSNSSITFDSITLTNAGSSDIFIVKYDSSGYVIWAKSAGGSDGESGYGIAIDSSGYVYATGSYYSTSIAFDNYILTNGSTDSDIFVVKYDSSGNVIWAKNADGSGNDYSASIAADGYGHVYVTGQFSSSSITFDSITLTNINASSADIFVVKYDSSGNVIWAESAGGTNSDGSLNITTDGNGNIYVTGFFNSSSITFGSTTLTTAGSHDVFVAKYDSNGNVIWAKSAGGIQDDTGNGIAIDGSGNVYLSGYFMSPSITFGSTTLTNSWARDIFVAKLESSVTDIKEEIFSDAIAIYPNPFYSQTILETNNSLKSATLTIDNVFGQTIRQIKNISGQTVTLQRDNLPGGLYFVRLSEDNKIIAIKKLVICD